MHGGQVERQRLQRRHRHGGGLQRGVVLVDDRRLGGLGQPQREPLRNGLLARRLGHVERGRQGLDAQQGRVVQRVETGRSDADQALDGLRGDARRPQLRGADGVGAPQQESEAIQPRDLVGCQVVEQDGIGHQGRQFPLVDEPGTDRAVVRVEDGALQLGQVVLALVAREDRAVGIAQAAEQQQLSDVVQQAGQIGLLGLVVAETQLRRDATGQFGHQQRMTPEARQVARVRPRHALEGRLHQQARCDGAHHPRSQHQQRLLDAAQFGTAAKGGGVGRREDAGAQRRILQHEAGERLRGRRVAARRVEETQQDLGHRRHVQRLDGPQDRPRHSPHWSVPSELHWSLDRRCSKHQVYAAIMTGCCKRNTLFMLKTAGRAAGMPVRGRAPSRRGGAASGFLPQRACALP